MRQRHHLSELGGREEIERLQRNDLPVLLFLAQLAVNHFAALDDGAVLFQAAHFQGPIQIDRARLSSPPS